MAKSDGLRTLALVNGENRLIGYAKVLKEDHWTGPRTVQDKSGATFQVALRMNNPDLPTEGRIHFDPVSGSFMTDLRMREITQMRALVGAPGGKR